MLELKKSHFDVPGWPLVEASSAAFPLLAGAEAVSCWAVPSVVGAEVGIPETRTGSHMGADDGEGWRLSGMPNGTYQARSKPIQWCRPNFEWLRPRRVAAERLVLVSFLPSWPLLLLVELPLQCGAGILRRHRGGIVVRDNVQTRTDVRLERTRERTPKLGKRRRRATRKETTLVSDSTIRDLLEPYLPGTVFRRNYTEHGMVVVSQLLDATRAQVVIGTSQAFVANVSDWTLAAVTDDVAVKSRVRFRLSALGSLLIRLGLLFRLLHRLVLFLGSRSAIFDNVQTQDFVVRRKVSNGLLQLRIARKQDQVAVGI